ncbi:hypothetical protein N7481_003403 [Penicillium waksmanii]|uniref:uncharacterized protein n=1 Tax=Penicillium waksmanii TaxID=69791 RepID=UPI0025479234|nr:uncharacterized protein N7481_003403 [Penicillium waksmanii]KAJ5988193.1 hypothetical protein N7481_003403 [Penicillium waksmanii]
MEIDSHLDPDSDSDYEYEYHPTETESFYLNLDLTAHHGAIRPPRQRQPDKAKDPSQDDDDPNQPIDTFTPLDSAEESLTRERIQILALHTCNPIIAYQNQIFSCSWADQIGTELLFAHPETDPDMDPARTTPLRNGPAFELLAANSVKIVGRKANLTSSSGLSGTGSASQNASGALHSGPGPGPSTGQSHQAQFIAKLQALKKNKGETDEVRTIYRVRKNVDVAERLAAWAKTEAQVADVQKLREKAANGDVDAMEQLEMLFRAYYEEDSEYQDQDQDQDPS